MTNRSILPRLRITKRLVFFIFLLNFVAFVAIATYLGGDAVNGKVEDGRYYLYGMRTEYGHKVYTEVSKSVFDYSRWHIYSLCATFALVIVTAVAENRDKKHSGGS